MLQGDCIGKDYFMSHPLSNVDAEDLPSIAFDRSFPFFKLAIHYAWYAVLSVLYVQNFWDIAFLMLGATDKARLAFRDGTSQVLRRQDFRRPLYLLLFIKKKKYPIAPSADFSKVSFDYCGRNLTLEGPDSLGLAYDVFFGQEYAHLPVCGKTVVDVGANIGDTAIYFCMQGASRVIAFEPYPYSFRLAKKNIRKNGFQRRVQLLEAAVGAKNSRIRLDGASKSFGGSQVAPSKNGKWVKVANLGGVLAKIRGQDAVLKLDCEGAEYSIILPAQTRELRRFSHIILEFHYGHANLAEKLKSAGFDVRLQKRPAYSFNRGWKNQHARTGLMEAVRV